MRLFFALFISLSTLYSYEKIATSFLIYLDSKNEIKECEILYKDREKIGEVCHLNDSGYILVSNSKDSPPIKAYSMKSDFKSLPKAYREFLLKELQKSAKIGRSKNKKSDSLYKDAWEFLEEFGDKTGTKRALSSNLLKTNWGQGFPYNQKLPQIEGRRVASGCVNIALAQIMNYYSHPSYAKGGYVDHRLDNETLKSILNNKYHWNLIDDGAKSKDRRKKALSYELISYLVRDLAILNKTSLNREDRGGSGARVDISSFISHFDYSTNISYISSSDPNFFKSIKEKIDKKEVVLLILSAHAAIADGYEEDIVGESLHINLGWDGVGDNYYYIDRALETPYGEFDSMLGAYIDIAPCSEEIGNCPKDREELDFHNYGEIEGFFDYHYDIDKYDIYLEGNTTIEGSRGFLNQAFFITVLDSDGKIVVSSSNKIERVFDRGWYTFLVSLCQGGCFSYLNAYTKYTINYTKPLTFPISKEIKKPEIDSSSKRVFLSPSQNRALYLDIRDIYTKEPTVELFYNSDNLRVDQNGTFLEIGIKNIDKKENLYIVATNEHSATKLEKIEIVETKYDLYSGKSFLIYGGFSSIDSLNSYKVLLDGNCSIRGRNNYAQQAFYIEIGDDKEILREFDNSPIERYFKAGVYTIRSSLKNQKGAYYEFSTKTDEYIIDFLCPNYSLDTPKILSILGENEVKVEIEKGWNLLGNTQSGPLKREKIGEELSLWRYSFNSWIENPKEILPCEGFWIYSNENFEFNFDDAMCKVVEIKDGWNLLGMGKEIENPKESFGASVVWVYKSGAWIENPKKIEIGVGFWVKVGI